VFANLALEPGMNKTLLAGPVLAAVLGATSAEAQSSISCMYMLLRVYKAELDYCRVPLPAQREARYQRMKAGMEAFIRKHGKNDPEALIKGVDNNIRRALAGLKSCQSEDFRLAQQAMDQLTEPENEKMVADTLKIPRDPQLGTCG
jgi:hypothetical protein